MNLSQGSHVFFVCVPPIGRKRPHFEKKESFKEQKPIKNEHQKKSLEVRIGEFKKKNKELAGSAAKISGLQVLTSEMEIRSILKGCGF